MSTLTKEFNDDDDNDDEVVVVVVVVCGQFNIHVEQYATLVYIFMLCTLWILCSRSTVFSKSSNRLKAGCSLDLVITNIHVCDIICDHMRFTVTVNKTTADSQIVTH